jgi:hypothetical protein
MQAANAYSPVGAALSGIGSNRQLSQGLANWMTGTAMTPQQQYNQATQYAATSPTGWLDF